MITPIAWQRYDADEPASWWDAGRPVVLIERWSAVTIYASNATPGAGTRHVIAWAYLPDPEVVIGAVSNPPARISRRLSSRPSAVPTCGQTQSRWVCTLEPDHPGSCSWDRRSEPRSYGDRPRPMIRETPDGSPVRAGSETIAPDPETS